MPRLEIGNVPQNITAGAFAQILRRIAHAVNFIDDTNFGPYLRKRLFTRSEIFLALADAKTTTSTGGINIGGYVQWNRAEWPETGTFHLVGDISISDPNGTATLILMGVEAIGQVSTQQTTLTRVVSPALAMPDDIQNLWVNLKSSSSSYTARVMKAELRFQPS